ncbi:MAG: CoA-binding protein [Anaerolineales bacterium]|nr:CoA-binding protein [Anaerolineales bacterium]
MSLSAFFNPNSVAVIGASSNPSKLGHAVVKNLIEGGFLGDERQIYPINLKSDEILGLKAYPNILDVPGQIDLAVIVIPYPAVPEVIQLCGEKGIPAAIIISAGFREAGMEGLEREQEVIEIAKNYGIRLIGPNCLGVIDTFTPLNASFSAGMPPSGPMAFMSQSGALGTAILDWAQAGRLGLSKFVSLGNKADVNEIDLLREWKDDATSNVILCYIEGLPDGEAFIRVAREVTREKPVIAIKSGVTQSGARAVTSHTGSLAGSEQAYQSAFHQAGVLRAESLEELFNYARGFGYLPSLKGDQIAIITNAGGPGILATDALERADLRLARFEPEYIQSLVSFLPDAASAANPIDVLGDARADRYRFALEKVIEGPSVDGVMVIVTPQAMTEIRETAEVVAKIATRTDKPIVACFMGEAQIEAGVEILERNNIPNYPYPEQAAKVLRALSIFRTMQSEPIGAIETFDVDYERVKSLIQKVFDEGRVTIGDSEARSILTAYGIEIPPSELAEDIEQAVEIADQMGYPVVLKIASPDILHKTDIGGVRVALQNAEDVRDSFDLITYRAQRYVPEARLWGCLVQKMVPPGLEVLIGMVRDPQFGPLITFGLGGIYVEILKDVAFRIAPFSRRETEEMLEEIKAHALLEGVRGQSPADKEALIDTILRISQLVTDFPEIMELDINPYIVYDQGRGGIALDMRLVLDPHETTP